MSTNPTIPSEAILRLPAGPDRGSPPRTRGRPPIKHDNRRIQRFVRSHLSAHDLCEHFPRIDDVFEGVVHLQSQGERHTRPLSRCKLFRVLQGCSVIDTVGVGEVLQGAAASTIARYAAAARASARAIDRLLDAHPGWEVEADRHAVEQQAVDAPYHAELRALRLL